MNAPYFVNKRENFAYFRKKVLVKFGWLSESVYLCTRFQQSSCQRQRKAFFEQGYMRQREYNKAPLLQVVSGTHGEAVGHEC